MEATAEPPIKAADYRTKRINYAMAAVLVAKGETLEAAAKACGAKNAKVLQVGLKRRGVSATAARNIIPKNEAISSPAVRIAAAVSEVLRDKAAARLEMQLDSLAAQPVGELASKGQGEASVLKTIAETHRTLFGGSDQINIVFGVSSLSGDGAQPQPVVVDAEIVPDQEAPS